MPSKPKFTFIVRFGDKKEIKHTLQSVAEFVGASNYAVRHWFSSDSGPVTFKRYTIERVPIDTSTLSYIVRFDVSAC